MSQAARTATAALARTAGAAPARTATTALARTGGVALALIATLSLAACAGNEPVPIGETQNVRVGVKTSDTFGKADMTVTKIGEIPAADAEAQGLAVSGYEDGVFFTVQVELAMTEGNYEPNNTYSLGETFWAAEGSDEIVPVDLGYFSKVELDGCQVLDGELTEQLAAGETIQMCQIMVAAAGTELESVTFGKQLTRRSGEKWTWEVE